MQVLQDFVARQYLAQLSLSEIQKKLADDIVGLLDSKGRVSIANLKKTLFPYDELDAVNTRLRRLRKEIERLSGETQASFALRVTDAKKVGPEARFLWFEGVNNWSPAVSTPELDAIPTSGEYVSKANESGSTPIALLLTFNEHEAHQLWAEFGGVRNELPREGVTYYELDGVGGFRVIHRHSRQGPQEAQLSATQAIDHWNPQLLIAVGIAFGVNEKKQHLRDVLVSEKVLDYELARVEPDGTFTYRGTPQETSRELAERVANINLQRRGNAGWPTIHTGIMLSGAKLVDNEEYRNTIASLHSKVIGGEMEGSGILTACSRDGVDMIVVKAICDWASHKDTPSKEEDQKKAAQSAAIVARAILEKGHLTGTIPTLKQENLALKKQLDELKNPQHRAPRFPDVLRMGEHDEVLEEKRLIRDSRASSLNLDPKAAPGIPAQGTPVVDAMLDWVVNPTEPQLFALLGEYGMGKTVSCQRFTRELAERRKANPTLPMPLYFNLKNVADARLADNLEDLVVTCMRDDWLPKHSPQHTWQAFTSWLTKGPCVVIFDGLDEMLVKLDSTQGSLFLNRLLGTLQLLDDEDSNRRIRLVLSCRTQYFRTLLDQRSFFLGKDRQDLRADSYRAMTLLPLGDDQIHRYLEAALPGSDIARIMELVASVHNLPELAARPYTLRLIAEHIPEIERTRASGKPVFGVTLYTTMVERWLERDEGKHFIDPEHKSAFMAELAAWLWREKKTAAPAKDVETIFRRWIRSDEDLSDIYPSTLTKSDKDKLNEDLRTATFLARQDDERGSTFRFAHTSLQEYFLARYLLDAIQRDDRSRWAMRIPSAETLDFLGQLLAEAQDPELIDTLASWKTPYLEQASELLLRYTFAARKRKYPAPNLARIDLSGAHLDDWDFLGTPDNPLNLAEANFTNTSLRRTAFSHANLTGAHFTKAALNQATFHNCTTRHTNWRYALYPGAAWRTPAQGIPTGMEMGLYPSHTSTVTGVAWHPTDNLIATTSSDHTCIIWNPHTGEKTTTLTGHTSTVTGVAWNPDGTRLATVSWDGTGIVWDSRTGHPITTLAGHTDWVTGVAWHPTGTHLATASSDGTCIIWNPHTAEKIATLTDWVTGVAWHPTGTHLATASSDGT
ncbi:NACHT domain-containing protein, partial [Arachnia propionica]|uniref:phosphorylase family protein n=1 Tax=Arachnia propionica TaxID=1750 RepID=UPI00242E4591